MEEHDNTVKKGRRNFLVNAGRAACGLVLGGVAYRVLSAYASEETAGPKSHWVWQIDPQKCALTSARKPACANPLPSRQ